MFVRFARELRRRRVFTTAGLYIVGAWLLLQVADVVFPGWGIPDTGINLLLIAAVLGFPVALVFGWFFNITARGIRRTMPAVPEGTGEPRPLKGNDYFILGTLVLVAGGIVSYSTVEVLAMRGSVPPPVVADKPPNSIAVLPFVNESSDPENQYFCAGVAEEILNRLARYPELNVTGRTSSWQFRDSDYSIPRISNLLGVRYLLLGTVQKVDDQLRISPQLVDETGTIVWAETFKRTLKDVFEMQEEVSDLVATTVAPQIVPHPTIVYEPNVDSYEHFLRGRELLHRRDWKAQEELQQAAELDPGFAEAYAELAIAILIGSPTKSDVDIARETIETALTLVPGMPRALAARGLLLEQQSPPDYKAAEVVLRQALEQEPRMVDAMNWLGQALSNQGKTTEAHALIYRAYGFDRLHPSIATNMADLLMKKGDLTGAERVLVPLVEVPDPSFMAFRALGVFYRDTGQIVKMNQVERRHALINKVHYYGLALSYAMLAIWDKAEYWMQRSIRDFPTDPYILAYPSQVDRWRGRYPAALEDFDRSIEANGADPEKIFWYTPIYGYYLAMAGDYQKAVEILRPYIELGRKIEGDYNDREALHALAFAWLRSGETQRAKDILESIESWAASHEIDGGSRRSAMAYFLARNAALLGDKKLALGRLRNAIDAGWCGYYINDHDPRWDSLKDDPRYRAMMKEVKADVDKQRLAVEKLDAEQDLPALVDEVRAERVAAVP